MDTGAGYVLRVARLTRDGELLGLPLEERADPLTGPELHVSDDGVVLIWGEPGDRTLMRNEEGFTAHMPGLRSPGASRRPAR